MIGTLPPVFKKKYTQAKGNKAFGFQPLKLKENTTKIKIML